MHFKALALFGLTASALAAPDQVVKRQDSALSSLASLAGVSAIPTGDAILSSLDNIASSITAMLPPSSILSAIQTAVPSSVLSELADPAKASSIASEIENGATPDWYASLSGDVKSYFSSYTSRAGAVATSVEGAVSSATEAVGSAINSATATGVDAASQTGGAARNGVLMAGAAGVAGVLGLAIAL